MGNKFILGDWRQIIYIIEKKGDWTQVTHSGDGVWETNSYLLGI